MIEMPCANCRTTADKMEQESFDFHLEFAEITFKCPNCGYRVRLIYNFTKLEALNIELCTGCNRCLYGHVEQSLSKTKCAAPYGIFKLCKDQWPTFVTRYYEYIIGEIL